VATRRDVRCLCVAHGALLWRREPACRMYARCCMLVQLNILYTYSRHIHIRILNNITYFLLLIKKTITRTAHHTRPRPHSPEIISLGLTRRTQSSARSGFKGVRVLVVTRKSKNPDSGQYPASCLLLSAVNILWILAVSILEVKIKGKGLIRVTDLLCCEFWPLQDIVSLRGFIAQYYSLQTPPYCAIYCTILTLIAPPRPVLRYF